MNPTRLDCGGPVHPTGATCDGVQVLYHDSAADTTTCPGTGIHVQAVAVPFEGASDLGLMDTSADADAISTLQRVRSRLLALPGDENRSDERGAAA